MFLWDTIVTHYWLVSNQYILLQQFQFKIINHYIIVIFLVFMLRYIFWIVYWQGTFSNILWAMLTYCFIITTCSALRSRLPHTTVRWFISLVIYLNFIILNQLVDLFIVHLIIHNIQNLFKSNFITNFLIYSLANFGLNVFNNFILRSFGNFWCDLWLWSFFLCWFWALISNWLNFMLSYILI